MRNWDITKYKPLLEKNYSVKNDLINAMYEWGVLSSQKTCIETVSPHEDDHNS